MTMCDNHCFIHSVNRRNQLRWPLTDEEGNENVKYYYSARERKETMQFAGKWMEPENTEAAWAQNDTYHLFCLLCKP